VGIFFDTSDIKSRIESVALAVLGNKRRSQVAVVFVNLVIGLVAAYFVAEESARVMHVEDWQVVWSMVGANLLFYIVLMSPSFFKRGKSNIWFTVLSITGLLIVVGFILVEETIYLTHVDDWHIVLIVMAVNLVIFFIVSSHIPDANALNTRDPDVRCERPDCKRSGTRQASLSADQVDTDGERDGEKTGGDPT